MGTMAEMNSVTSKMIDIVNEKLEGEIIEQHLTGVVDLEELDFGSSSFEDALTSTEASTDTWIDVLSPRPSKQPPPPQDVESQRSDKKAPRPSALKMYSSPFHSYFNSLLQEDDGGKSVADSLQYSPSTYAVSVWKESRGGGDDDDISSMGGSMMTSSKSLAVGAAGTGPAIPVSGSGDTDVSHTSSEKTAADPKKRILEALRRATREPNLANEDGRRKMSVLWRALAVSWVCIIVLIVVVVVLMLRSGGL